VEAIKQLIGFALRRAEAHFHQRRFVLNVSYMFHACGCTLVWYTCLSKLPNYAKMKSQREKNFVFMLRIIH